jgi:hypothetical protein
MLTERQHRIVYVRDAAAVERFNKIYLPIREGDSLLLLLARTYQPDGTVRNIDATSELREVDDLQESGAFRLLAVEGLVPGGMVEYAYVRRRPASFFGREMWQRNIPVRDATFWLTAPFEYQFQATGYNGFPAVEDSLSDATRFLLAHVDRMEPAYRERYARYETHLQRLDWRMQGNLLQGGEDPFTWEAGANRFASAIYAFGKDDEKAVRRFIKGLGIKSAMPSTEKQALVERGIKSRIAWQEAIDPAQDYPAGILTNLYGSSFGLMRLYALCWIELGIDHEVVLTADGEGPDLDSSFPFWHALTEMGFYFPEGDNYLDPLSDGFRLGAAPPAWLERPAIHLRPAGETFTMRWRTIPSPPLKDHYEDLTVTLRMSDDRREAELSLSRSFSGYRATVIQPYWERISPTIQEDAATEILRSSAPDATLTDWSAFHGSMDDVYAGIPFRLEASLTSSAVLEQAGKRTLIKIGELIGPQVAMYAVRPRLLPINVEYPHGYRRQLTVQVPDGFALRGLEALTMNHVVVSPAGDTLMAFLSTYTLREGELVVQVHEYYAQTNYPADLDAAFRRVINAAADFNKHTLILEPE